MEGHWPQGSFIHGQRPGRLEVHEAIVVETLKDELVGHVSRDSTAIVPSERPVNRKKDTETQEKPRKKRGRPKKGEEQTNELTLR